MTVNEKISALRKIMAAKGLDAWLVNGTDPHESEYVCPRYRTRDFLTGFTGSAGFVVITATAALLWVDSRYFVQCEAQIKGTCIEMKKLDGPEASRPSDWIKNNLKAGSKAGIADETLMVGQKRRFEEKWNDCGIALLPMEDIVDSIWPDRPDMPCSKVVKLSDDLCGESVASKLSRIRESLSKDGADYTLISSLDDIAWALNLRGNDIEDTPVFMAHLVVGKDSAVLFTDEKRFENISKRDSSYQIKPYYDVCSYLAGLSGCTLRLNPDRVNMRLFNAIPKTVKVVQGVEYTTDFKACKNQSELNGMRVAHIMDGAAICNFMGRLQKHRKAGEVFTELSASELLSSCRKEHGEYLGPSFGTIAGFGPHGAVVHYSATKQTDAELVGSGLLVLDSGGQYVSGTTDVTRTLLFGRAKKVEKEAYTRVLKGHLALASLVFPEGTDGHHIDSVAHKFLWEKGWDFFHGTGHGVGFRLSVHEGPQRISASPGASKVTLKPGMVISDEPGVYLKDRFGVRIENLVAVVPAFETEFGKFYTFEVLTCVPYERSLIDKTLLSQEEINLINSYHSWVFTVLQDFVDEDGLRYLKEATRPL